MLLVATGKQDPATGGQITAAYVLPQASRHVHAGPCCRSVAPRLHRQWQRSSDRDDRGVSGAGNLREAAVHFGLRADPPRKCHLVGGPEFSAEVALAQNVPVADELRHGSESDPPRFNPLSEGCHGCWPG